MATWKKVKNTKDLMIDIIKTVEKDNKIILNVIAEDVRNILYIYTQNWYNSHNPATYQRTYEFINSLTVRNFRKEYSGTWIEIGFDPEKMSLGNNNNWRQHEDRYNLSNIINNGWSTDRNDLIIQPMVFNSVDIKGSEAIDNTIKYLESSGFLVDLKKEFKKKGYNLM